MTAADDLLHRIENGPEAARLLCWPGDFDIERRDPVEELRLPTGKPLTPIAGCGAGGTYFLCGRPEAEQRPVLYTSSEGQATLIGNDLVEAITLIANVPYWQDLGAGFPADQLEEMIQTDHPTFNRDRQHLLATLDLPPLPPQDALPRLRAAAAQTAPDFVPIMIAEDHPYELLFGQAPAHQGP